MDNIKNQSELDGVLAVELQPGNTLSVKLANYDALVTIRVPVDGLAWCDVYGNGGKISRLFTFALRPVPLKRQAE